MGLPPGEPPPEALPVAGQVVIADVVPGRCPAADRSIPHDRPNAITRSSCWPLLALKLVVACALTSIR